MRSALFGLVLLAGCVEPADPSELPPADFALFADTVQPVYANRCANPSCHGSADRPLALYAAWQYRIDSADLWSPPPISDVELEANFDRSRALLVGLTDPGDSQLLRRPLDPDAGGADHAGGVQFGDDTDADYLAIEAWIEDALMTAETQ